MRVGLHGEDGYLLANVGFRRAGFEHDFEDTVIRNHLDSMNLLCKIDEKRDVSKRVVFTFSRGSENDDVRPAVGETVTERLVEVVRVLFCDMDDHGGELLPQFGGNAVQIADDGGGHAA